MTTSQIDAENTQMTNDLYRLLKKYSGLRNLIRQLKVRIRWQYRRFLYVASAKCECAYPEKDWKCAWFWSMLCWQVTEENSQTACVNILNTIQKIPNALQWKREDNFYLTCSTFVNNRVRTYLINHSRWYFKVY